LFHRLQGGIELAIIRAVLKQRRFWGARRKERSAKLEDFHRLGYIERQVQKS
jgi:hypothetical protein